MEQVRILSSPDFKMDGSKDYPYIVIVNDERPEANYGFEVSLVPGIEVRGYVRTAYHIRKVRKNVCCRGMKKSQVLLPHVFSYIHTVDMCNTGR